eukprot:TRINITY_DN1978_c0_g1_i1.p1 TRINITY_DN1978_c0_g1~~TRINITY_DN1978_c0_g1_i1.p1  ORF type:complete len:314 (+),score=47.47 TRINITY_DN1978_c0_g1_i1:228-1169(+)
MLPLNINIKDHIKRYAGEVINPHSTIRKLLVIPLVVWLVVYFSAPIIPASIRPPIDVRTLRVFDLTLFRYLPSDALGRLACLPLDLLGAVGYTIHMAWPFVFLAYLLWRERWLVLPYVNCFGIINCLGLITQLVLPTAPPWYFEKYGFSAASYALKGDPAGLERVDEHFNISFYKNMFYNSPLVFGSFPSLHVGWPSMLALFIVFEARRLKAPVKCFSVFYVVYISLVVIYLQHHYVVDVIGGMVYAFTAYQLTRPRSLPPASYSSLASSASLSSSSSSAITKRYLTLEEGGIRKDSQGVHSDDSDLSVDEMC